MTKKFLKQLLCLIVFLTIFDFTFFNINVKAINNGNVYYVSYLGNDSNSGDINHPFRTIGTSIKRMSPGDTLLIRRGTYNEGIAISSMNGSPDARYTIKNYNNEPVEITGYNGTGTKRSVAFNIYNCSYWNIDGIKIDNFTDAGIYLGGKCNHINMLNLTIFNLDHTEDKPTGTAGILSDGGASYCIVKYCEIYNVGLTLDTQKDHGVYIGYGASNWTFDSNRIHDNAGAGIQLYGDPTGGNNCTITNNVLYNNHNWGIVISSNATGNLVANNLFYNNKDCDVYFSHSAYGNTVVNNILGTTVGNVNLGFYEDTPSSNTCDYNVYAMKNRHLVYTDQGTFDLDKWKATNQEVHGIFTLDSQIPNGKIYTSKRLSGSSKLDSCKAIAEEYNNETVDNVVITSGLNYPDALGGSLLASSLNAPILLVNDSAENSQQTIDYIKAHLNTNGTIYILGGTGAVSDCFESSFKSLGFNNIQRIYGQDRYDTNKAIYNKLNINKGTPIIIASGENFPDALSISSVSGIKGYPIILTAKDSLSPQAADIIKNTAPSTIYIAGGSGVVSDQVRNQILAVSGLSDNNVIRLWGENRYETSINIVKYFNIDTKNACFVNGDDFQDALAGSILATKLKAPIILLQNGMNLSSQKNYIDNSSIVNLIYFGDSEAISNSLLNSLKK